MSTLKQSWFTLSCLQLSGALSLPVIMIGYYLGQHYSLENCLIQIVLGNLSLFFLAAFYITVISKNKLLTVELAQCLLGPGGTALCAAGMVLSLLGWSAIQIHLLAATTSHFYLAVLGSALFLYFLTCKNLAYLARINKIILPFLVGSLGYFLVTAPQAGVTTPQLGTEPFKLGLVMILTAGSGLVFDLPTFYRHAATPRQAILSLALIFLLSLPLIEGLGIYLAAHYSNNGNWLQSFINSFNLPTLFLLISSGLLGSCLNLYSATMILNSTLGFSYRKMLFLCCGLSALLSLINLEQKLSVFLEIINLNAEIITVLIFIYVFFKGSQLPHPKPAQKRMHQAIFYLTIGFASCTKIFRLSLFNDLFLDTAFISCALMTIYYLRLGGYQK